MTATKWSAKEVLEMALLTALGIVCFPANPLVLTGALETGYSQPAYIAGWVVWSVGMILVISPMVMFPRRGEVAKGKSFVHTTRLVETGIYGVVRHPQYLGGILAVFLTTLLWYPHWLFAVLGVAGTAVVYAGCILEDRRMVQKFGDEYEDYMRRVPRVNLILGIIRLFRDRLKNPQEP